MRIARSQSVVPLSVKLIAFYHQRGELFIGDLDARRVRVFIKDGLDVQSLGDGCASNQIDHHLPTDQWPASPVGSDVAEHAMFNLVPFAGAWREDSLHLRIAASEVGLWGRRIADVFKTRRLTGVTNF